jgi:hypothetical protein
VEEIIPKERERERKKEGDRVGAERQSALVVGKYDSLSLSLSLSISLTFLFLSVFVMKRAGF